MYQHELTFKRLPDFQSAESKILPHLELIRNIERMGGLNLRFETEGALSEEYLKLIMEAIGEVEHSLFNINLDNAHFNLWMMAGDEMRIVQTMTVWKARADEQACYLTNTTMRIHLAVIDGSCADKQLLAEMKRKEEDQFYYEYMGMKPRKNNTPISKERFEKMQAYLAGHGRLILSLNPQGRGYDIQKEGDESGTIYGLSFWQVNQDAVNVCALITMRTGVLLPATPRNSYRCPDCGRDVDAQIDAGIVFEGTTRCEECYSDSQGD